MKTNTTEAIANAKQYTVIDDGQFMFPVMSSDMTAWTAVNGDLEDNDRYNQFCQDVKFVGEGDLGSVGSDEVIAFCNALIEAGAEVLHLS